MPLIGFNSLCNDHAPIIVSQDYRNPQKHVAYNVKKSYVTHYKIDGVVIQDGNRCDFLLLNEDTKIAYLIELKGSDLSKAAEQLEATEKKLSQELNAYSKRYRIISNKCKTTEINHSSYLKYKTKWGKNLVQRSGIYPENI